LTQKRADFELFKQIVEILSRKDLTQEDLQEIINIRASINKGLSDTLKDSFPNVEPVSRPKVQFSEIPDPHGLAGFTDAEGCFRGQRSSSFLFFSPA